MSNNLKGLLVGTGYMGLEHYKVLKDMPNLDITVVSRGQEKASEFKRIMGVSPITGGIENIIKQQKFEHFDFAIVATNTNTLASIAELLLNYGIKRLLIEKPAGGCEEDIVKIQQAARKKEAQVFVAYNRRFYSSVRQLEECAVRDSGIKSFCFEFTEWGHKIRTLKKPQNELKEWLLLNSSHVIDLAFYLGGKPIDMKSYIAGSCDWHPNAAIYTGAGVSNLGALFSYHANWEGPGRWGIECVTNKYRYYLRPLEELHVQKLGTITIEKMPLDNDLDIKYKPGIYSMLEAFIYQKNDQKLVTIDDQVDNLSVYKEIENCNR